VARISEAEYRTNMETLGAMFPNVDPEVCEVVFRTSECRLYAAIETLLEMSNPNYTNIDSNDNNGNDNGNNIENVNAARDDGEYYNSISGQGGDPEKNDTAAT